MKPLNSILKCLSLALVCFFVFSGFTLKDWIEAGFTASEARKWDKAGFILEAAKGWRDAGSSLSEAKEWEKTGLSRSTAKEWMKEGFTPSKTKEWRDAGFFSPAKAQKWKATKFTPAEAEKFKKKGFDLEEAKRLKESDLGKKWKKTGLDLIEAKEWEEAGFSPASAKEWKTAGIDLLEAIERKKDGYSAFEAKEQKANENRIEQERIAEAKKKLEEEKRRKGEINRVWDFKNNKSGVDWIAIYKISTVKERPEVEGVEYGMGVSSPNKDKFEWMKIQGQIFCGMPAWERNKSNGHILKAIQIVYDEKRKAYENIVPQFPRWGYYWHEVMPGSDDFVDDLICKIILKKIKKGDFSGSKVVEEK